MLLTSFHSISCSGENRKQLWCVSDEWQSNLSEHEAVRLLPSVWWIFWDVASVLLHFTAPVLGFTPFSALQTPSSDFITLPVHSGSKHLIPLKHCEKHSLSLQKPHQLWPIGKNLHPSVWEGFSLLDSTLLVKTMLALFRADEPICCGRLEKLPLTIPGVTRKKPFDSLWQNMRNTSHRV